MRLGGNAFGNSTGIHSNGRKLVCARDANLRLRFEYPGCRNANVIVLLKGGFDQILQDRILECFPPLLVTEGCSFFFTGFLPTISIRNSDLGLCVIRPYFATKAQESERDEK